MSDPQLSDLQLALLRILWDRGEATAAEVHEGLRDLDRALAPTTVATLLSRLEKRGLVHHESRGRAYVYRATVPEHEVRRSMLAKVTDYFFAGDPAALVSHLLGGREVTPEELAAIHRLVDASRGESNDDGDG